jgi:hypothetical protein
VTAAQGAEGKPLQPSSNRVRVDGSWCTRLAPYEGAGFHVVPKGTCRPLPDGGAPVPLGTAA